MDDQRRKAAELAIDRADGASDPHRAVSRQLDRGDLQRPRSLPRAPFVRALSLRPAMRGPAIGAGHDPDMLPRAAPRSVGTGANRSPSVGRGRHLRAETLGQRCLDGADHAVRREVERDNSIDRLRKAAFDRGPPEA